MNIFTYVAVCSLRIWALELERSIILLFSVSHFQSSVEPMQVDAPPEENENVEEEHFIVENTSLVSIFIYIQT